VKRLKLLKFLNLSGKQLMMMMNLSLKVNQRK